MNVALQLGLIVASVAGLFVIMATVRFLARRHGWSKELQRKCVHVATGLYALTLPLTFHEAWPVLLLTWLGAMVLLVMRLPRFANSSLGQTVHGVERKSYGELLLVVSVGFVFYFSLGNPVLYVLPIAVLTLSDAAAALVGTRYGQKFFEVEAGTKSIEGCTVFFTVTWLTAMILLLTMTDIPRVNVILLSLVIAAFGALVEANSWRGFDNLFVPVGIHLFLAYQINATPLQLAAAMLVFAAIVAAILVLAPLLGLSQHAARAYAVLVFLIGTVAGSLNAILPIAAVLAHLAARRMRPYGNAYPDLDFVTFVACVGLFWLFLGSYAERVTLDFNNLTFAAAALAYLALAAGRRRIAIVLAAAVLLFVAFMQIARWNTGHSSWDAAFWPWAAASFALSLAVPMVWPGAFDRYRASRTLALALPVPLTLYVIGVLIP